MSAENSPEESLVGAVLAGYPDAVDLMSEVEPSDLENHRLAAVWRAIGSLVADGDRPIIQAVDARLRRDNPNVPNVAVWLNDLASRERWPASAPYYAQRVRSAARRRKIRDAAVRVSQLVDDAAFIEDVDGLADAARSEMEAATQVRSRSDLHSTGDGLTDLWKVAEEGLGRGLPLPWRKLDAMIRGFQPGRLVVVGARPAVGKSMLCVEMAHEMAFRHRRPVLYSSLEMPKLELDQRIVANHTGIPLSDLDGDMSSASWDELARSHSDLQSLSIHVDDRADQTLSSIRSRASEVRRRHGDLGLIVVDYLQLIRTRDSGRSRAEQVSELSRGLKVLARETEACVVAAAQVNRAPTMRSNSRPALSDLRESGAIEADADVVLMLHREEVAEGVISPEVEAFVAKNRSGPIGSVMLDQQAGCSRFREIGASVA